MDYKMKDVLEYIGTLKHFINRNQLSIIGDACRREEAQWFKNKLVELGKRINAMPGPYGQDGKRNEAIAYLKYFSGNMTWYITEKDHTPEQCQAYGAADVGYGFEMGYISISELNRMGSIELDLHFEPTPLKDLGV